MGSSLIQQLYNTVDLMFVGNIVGKEASAAVGSTSLLTVCILGFFMGMGVGVGVITAHAFGARQDKALKNTIHTAIGLAIALSVVATAIGLAICPFFLKWMHVPKHITGLALTYIRLYLLGMFAIVCYNVATGIIRALGNARSPLIYAIIGGLVNVGANALLMSVFRMGITGAALATVLSQALSAALALRYLCRLPDRWRLELRKITIDWALTRRIMRLAIPEAIRSMLMTFANILIQTGINGLGVSSMAAYAAYGKVEGFIYFPQWSVGQANTTFVSQNLGAGNLKRTERSTKVALAMGIGITLITSGIAILAAYPIFRAFSADPWVIEISVRSARAAYGLYFLYAIVEVLAGAIRGSGTTTPPMVITMVTLCGFRVLILNIALHYLHTLNQIVGIVFPATWGIAAMSFAIYYFSGLWKRNKTFQAAAAPSDPR